MSKKKIALVGLLIGLGAGIAATIGFKKLRRSIKLEKLKSFVKDIKKKNTKGGKK